MTRPSVPGRRDRPDARPTIWGATLAVALGAPAGAVAADLDPPVIDHVEVREAVEGRSMAIRARITDPSGVFAPAVYVRRSGTERYLNVRMAEGADGYEATIPAGLMIADVEYFIEAFDQLGNGPARVGSPDRPIRVAVGPPPPPRPPGAVPPPPRPPGAVPPVPRPPGAVPPPPRPPGAVPPVGPPPSAPPTRSTSTEPDRQDDDGGVLGAWWFWTLVGVAAAGGATAAALVLSDRGPVDQVSIEVRGPDPSAGLP